MAEDSGRAIARRYANWLEVGFTRDEIVLDFGQRFDDAPPIVHVGIVTNPSSAESFLEVLKTSLEEHSKQFVDRGDRK